MSMRLILHCHDFTLGQWLSGKYQRRRERKAQRIKEAMDCVAMRRGKPFRSVSTKMATRTQGTHSFFASLPLLTGCLRR